MSILRNVTLRTKILAGFIAVLALLIGALVHQFVIAAHARDELASLLREDAVAIERVQELGRLFVDLETGQRGYLITGDEAFLAPYTAAHGRFDRLVAELQASFAGDPDAQDLLERCDHLRKKWLGVAGVPEIELRKSMTVSDSQLDQLLRTVQRGAAQRLSNDVRQEISRLRELSVRRGDATDRALAAELQLALEHAERGERGFLLAGGEDFLLPYHEGRQSFESVMKQLWAHRHADPEMQACLKRIEARFGDWVARGATPEIDLRMAYEHSPTSLRDISELLGRAAGKDIMDSSREAVATLIRHVHASAEKKELEARRAISRGATASVAASSLAVLVAFMAFALVTGPLLRQSQRLLEGVAALGKGTLTHRIPVESADELGQLTRAFNDMGDRMEIFDRHVKEATAHVESIVESVPDSLFVVGADGRVRKVNSQLCGVVGRRADELLGAPVRDLIAPSDQAAFDELIRRTLEQGAVRDVDCVWLGPEKLPIPMSLNASRLGVEGANGGGVVCVARDLRETKRMVAEAAAAAERQKAEALSKALGELREAHRQLKEVQLQVVQAGKLAALGQLGAGIAHELNQPITSIRGFAQRIRRAAVERFADQLGEIDIILQATQRMSLIVNNVRAFSRQSASSPRPIEAMQPVEDTLMLLGEQMRLHGIRVERVLDPALPRILGDSGRLQQVFTNLVANARDAMDALPASAPRVLTIRVSRESGCVRYSIEDTGGGVPKNVRPHLFEPFFTTKPTGQGTGLGLSVSYGVVKELGGDIRYDDACSGGARFVVSMPVETAGSKDGGVPCNAATAS